MRFGAVREVHSTFTSELCAETYKLEVAPKPYSSTMEKGKIPAGDTTFHKPNGLYITLGSQETKKKNCCGNTDMASQN
jgi:hypothetical protein